jgi:short-subunit dehydrogenase
MRKFFITGVSSGLGLELMKQLVARGDFVYGVSRKEIPEDSVLTASKDKWIWRSCDVTRENEILATIEHQKSLGFLPDIVILNAGIFRLDDDEFVWTDYQKIFKVNCEGSLKWVECYLPEFKERQRGHFVYISSLSAKLSSPLRSMYAASKAYTSMVFGYLKKNYASTGIRFTQVFPGLIKTPMSADLKVSEIFSCSVSKASEKILRSIDSGKRDLYFPYLRILIQPLIILIPIKTLSKLLNRNGLV